MNLFEKIIERLKALFTGDGKAYSDVDLTAALDKKATGTGYQWKTSVVDFLKLIDLDSSLTNREILASELSVTVGEKGSAQRNEALRLAVFAELAKTNSKFKL